ncbi:hypothetical protein OQA88_13456 [Cercophora sp. LCS_1]
MAGAVVAGSGRHAATLRVSDFEHAVLLTLIGLSAGAASFTLAKAAIVILLIKVLRPPAWHAGLLWGLVTMNVIFIAVVAALYFLQCSPPQALWRVLADKRCWDPWVANYVAISGSAFSALTDFYLAVYPSVALYRLEISWTKKLALSVALGFGFCAGIVAVLKCTTVSQLLDKDDFTC